MLNGLGIFSLSTFGISHPLLKRTPYLLTSHSIVYCSCPLWRVWPSKNKRGKCQVENGAWGGAHQMREMVKKSNLALAQVPQNGIDHDGIVNKAS